MLNRTSSVFGSSTADCLPKVDYVVQGIQFRTQQFWWEESKTIPCTGVDAYSFPTKITLPHDMT